MGEIGGFDFVRINWKGTKHMKNSQDEMVSLNHRGTVFGFKEGDSLVVLAIEDFSSEDEHDLNVMIAAAFTFRKK